MYLIASPSDQPARDDQPLWQMMLYHTEKNFSAVPHDALRCGGHASGKVMLWSSTCAWRPSETLGTALAPYTRNHGEPSHVGSSGPAGTQGTNPPLEHKY